MRQAAELLALRRCQHLVDLTASLIHVFVHLLPDITPDPDHSIVVAADDLGHRGGLDRREIEIVSQALHDAVGGGAWSAARHQPMKAEKQQTVADHTDDDSAQDEAQDHERGAASGARRPHRLR
jgi:hypothetical protein